MRHWIAAGIFLWSVSQVAAQVAPTATEVFNLTIKCRDMVAAESQDRQAQLLANPKRTAQPVNSTYSSRYDPVSGRCFGDFFYHDVLSGFSTPYVRKERMLVDMLTGELVAKTQDTTGGGKLGFIIEKQFQTKGSWVEWSEAEAFIDRIMHKYSIKADCFSGLQRSRL